VRIEVARVGTTAALINQIFVATHGGGAKREMLRKHLREQPDFRNAIIFCNRKRDVAILHKSLTKHGFSAGALHGDMDQPARMASLDAFKRGEVALLVCSDVAARGLDIPDVSHVFNFDVPIHPDDYVHRIGRTGRAGKSGVAITLITDEDGKHIAAIEKLIKLDVQWEGPKLDELGDAPVDERRHRGDRERSGRRGERGGRTRDARGGREGRGERRPRREDAAEAPTAVAPEVEFAEAMAEAPAPRPVRERQERTERPARPVRAERAPAPRAQPEPRYQPEPMRDAQRPREEPRRRYRDDDLGPPVLGMGDHVPSFMMRPVRPTKTTAKQTEQANAED
jgi:superfamily II DNA/RNA helicase